jgi:hypothetical protein
MTNKMLGWTAAGVVIAVGGLYYVKTAHTKPAPSATAEPAAAREIAELRAEIQSLRRDTAVSLARNARTQEFALRDLAARPADSGEAAPPPTTPPPAAPELEEAEAAAQLDNHFDAERPDPAWSVQAAKNARSALTNTLPKGTTLKNVECRAKLCRIESVHESVDAYREFTNASLIGRGRQIWNGAISSLVRDQGPSGVVAVSYLSKEGEAIPPPEHPE